MDKAPRERFLCVCQQGDNRSVHLAYLLKRMLKEAIAVGIRETGRDSMIELIKWADRVVVLDSDLMSLMPESEKIEVWDIGKDIYPRPLNMELLAILNRKIEQNING